MVSPRRWRLVSSTACSAVALVAAGCGGEENAGELLPRGVGSMLVEQTQEVEDALAAKDFTTAREQALDLQDRVKAAIDAGRVPQSLRNELLSSVRDLVELIPEAPAPAEEEEEKDEEKDEDDKGKGKGKGQDKDADSTTVEVTTDLETDD